MRRYCNAGFIGGFFALLISTVAWAVPPVVAPTQPGQVQQHLQIEEERPEVGGPAIITLPSENGKNKPLKEGVTFEFKGVIFENLTVFTAEQLRPDYEPYLDKEVTLSTLNEIVSNITAHYRNAGYVLSRAVLSPQRIEDGIVRIRIISGYVDKVSFEGVKDTSGLLNDYADKIRDAKPLNTATLERYLLLIEDLPGVTAHAALRPSPSAHGASDIIITITQKPVDGSVTVDNRSTRYLGPVEGSVTVNANNALGLYDRTSLRGVSSTSPDEMRYAQVDHQEQLDSEGTKVDVSAGYTHTAPGYRLTPFDINGRDMVYSAEVSHPFIRSRQTNMYGDVKFDVRQTDTSSLGDNLYDDKLRVLRAGGSYDFVDPLLAINKFQGEVSKGLNWDTSSNTGLRSTATGTPDFIKGTMQASRLQPIEGPVNLYISTTGQASANTLLTAEQFSLGGANFGSAYDPSEIIGDSGIAGRVELQYNRSGDFYYLPNYQLYGFYDIGTVWTRNAAAGLKDTESLADVGVGTRFNIMEPVSGGLEIGWPLTRKVAADGGDGYMPRLFFSLAYRY